MAFSRSEIREIQQEMLAAVNQVLAKRGLEAVGGNSSFTADTYKTSMNVVRKAPSVVEGIANASLAPTVASVTTAAPPAWLTTDMLKSGQCRVGTPFEALVRDRDGRKLRVLITKRAVVRYQFTFLEGPNKGRGFAGPFSLFSLPEPIVAVGG